LEFLARAIRQEQEIKGFQKWKEGVQQYLLTDDMILYLRDPKNSTKKLLEIKNSFGKVAGYKINVQKPVAFYTPTTHRLRKIRETIPFTIASKKKYLRINLTKETKDLFFNYCFIIHMCIQGLGHFSP
jgi:hypothetical protein